jgi:CubicO group peptidase (beta-lactamase class C family)
VRVRRTTLVALAIFVSITPAIRAQQNLPHNLFERALEQLRLETGIPGLSAVIVQDGEVVWEVGLGMADLDRMIRATPDTPYVVGDLTQTLAATLVLQRIDRGDFHVNDRMERWTSLIPERSATVGEVMRHTSTGLYRYDPDRFATLEPVVEHYAKTPIEKILAQEILDPLSMRGSVPGTELGQATARFDPAALERYRDVLQQLAVPYRVDLQRRAIRSDYFTRRLTPAGGLISSARDLARFDAALDDPGLLLSAPAIAAMQQRGGATVPTGLGWFVQTYNNQTLVWHFGNIPNAFSSLIIRVPQRKTTLILLANSDGLSAPFALEHGDVTRSLFARAFLRAFLP